MTQETLKLALDTFEIELSIDWTNNDEFNASAEKMYEAIAAIKQALLQPEQEPVAWRRREVEGDWQYYGWEETGMEAVNTANKNGFECEAVPATPPQRTWVRLAAEDRLTAKYMQDAPDGIEAVIDYIEAKLKEKNT